MKSSKSCTSCKKRKPLSNFYKREKGRYASHCKGCHIAKTEKRRRERMVQDIEAYRTQQNSKNRAYMATPHGKRSRRNYDLKRAYGITLAEYEQMLGQQDGSCLICAATPGSPRNPRLYLDVDHDHATGEIRGLLCNSCNMGIGKFADNPVWLVQAAAHLMSKL